MAHHRHLGSLHGQCLLDHQREVRERWDVRIAEDEGVHRSLTPQLRGGLRSHAGKALGRVGDRDAGCASLAEVRDVDLNDDGAVRDRLRGGVHGLGAHCRGDDDLGASGHEVVQAIGGVETSGGARLTDLDRQSQALQSFGRGLDEAPEVAISKGRDDDAGQLAAGRVGGCLPLCVADDEVSGGRDPVRHDGASRLGEDGRGRRESDDGRERHARQSMGHRHVPSLLLT